MNVERKKTLSTLVFVALLVLTPWASAQDGDDQQESVWVKTHRR